MAAPLGGLLVFQLDRRRAGRFQPQHAVSDVVGTSKPSVGIDHQRDRDRPGQHAGLLHQLVEREQADVRNAERTGGEGRAREIDRAKSFPFDEFGGQRERRADDGDRRFRDRLPQETAAARWGRSGR